MFYKKHLYILSLLMALLVVFLGWVHMPIVAQSQPIRVQRNPLQSQNRFITPLLPAPLYFIDGSTHQIVRLETDGVTRTEITNEPSGVTTFDLAPTTGQIVFVTDQMLVAVDALGKGRRILYQHQQESIDTPGTKVQNVRISPDGTQVAFAAYGINLLPLSAPVNNALLLPNDPYSGTADMPDMRGYYYLPTQWSPNGERLLITAVNYWEGGKLLVLPMNENEGTVPLDLSELSALGCCSAVWKLDSQSLIVSRRGGEWSPDGLGQVALNSDGSATSDVFSSSLLQSIDDFSFAHPFPLSDDTLLAFGARTSGNASTKRMIRITLKDNQVMGIQPLRIDAHTLLDAVWSPDGSGAVIVAMSGNRQPDFNNSPLIWLSANGDAEVQLPIGGKEAHWGVLPHHQPPLELLRQAARDLEPTTLDLKNGTIATRFLGEMQTDQLRSQLWVAFTVGQGAPVPNGWPRLALYKKSDRGWHLLAKTDLEWSVSVAVDDIPYILTQTSVRLIQIEPTRLWIQVIASGPNPFYALLKFDGASLKRTVSTGGYGTIMHSHVLDLNQDGMREVVLTARSANSICPLCTALSDLHLILFRWNGEEIVQVEFSSLPPNAPQQLQTINERLLRQVQAGTWQAALSELDQANDFDLYDLTFTWNAALVRANLLLREAEIESNRNPFYQAIYLGDFSDAVETEMFQYPVDQIFDRQSPLLVDPTSDSQPSLTIYAVLDQVEDMFAVFPDSQSPYPYFLRAWAHYLRDPQNPAILGDLRRASELGAEDSRFASAFLFVQGKLPNPQEPYLIARKQVNVRLEPGIEYPVLGQLAAYEAASIVGVYMDSNPARQASDAWYQIDYPADSGGRGWVSNMPGLIWTNNTSSVPTVERQSPQLYSYLQPPTRLIVRTLLAQSSKSGRLYVLLSDEPRLAYFGTRAQLLVSEDFGESWLPFAGALPVPEDCLLTVNLDENNPPNTALAVEQADVLYASTCQGLYRWQGDRWQFINPQRTGRVIVALGNSSELWATAPFADPFNHAQAPLLHSTDGGITWHGITLTHYHGVANLVIDPSDRQTGFAIIWPKYSGSYLRRNTATSDWQIIPTPVDNHAIDTGMVLDDSSGVLYITLRTFDGAAQLWSGPNINAVNPHDIQWELVYDFGPGTWVDLLDGKSTPQGLVLYANVRHFHENPTLYRSIGGGKDWQVVLIQ